ncbi:peptidase inhibitor I78 [Caulobacter mirabilis]|uniref:Peptidase inhibitor I78 n=1 Tax=Caulobacter mirabilis TaxID=69666 RepID=A0A2D2AYZ6_9CAUL|nr:peptidase inhibitor I78 [Caulobacter mirabilis]ATQ43239.1 peptidase inhibitor I78 [Caulobacter mirabilis]
MKKLLAMAAMVGLAGCIPVEKPSAPTMEAAPPRAERPAEPAPQLPPPDSCKSADFAYLVGKNRSEIPVPTDPSKRRVTCTTCPMTMDYRPDRLNILYDNETGIVKEVKCG